jgi:HlyD family secretion protein
MRVGIPLAAALLSLLGWRILGRRSPQAPDAVLVSGNIEVTDAEASFKIAGRVIRRLVSEGDVVTNGQVVALLDAAELEKEAALRRAEAQAAEATLADLVAGSRPEEIEQAEAALQVARADARRQETDYARQKDLFTGKVITAREFDWAEAGRQVAAARVREAEARLALSRKGAREEAIAAVRFRSEQARQAAALAETRLGCTVLTAPLTGVVLAEGIECGEYVVPGAPVVTVGDLAHVWLRAYVNETDLGRVKTGQRVRVTVDTYPGKVYEGRLSFIASESEFTPRSIQTAKERVKLVYRVKVTIPNPSLDLKPGMPADAVIGPD